MPCRLTDNNAFVTRKCFVVVSCSVVISVILKFMVVIDLCLTVILMRSVVSSISSLSTLVMNYQIANLKAKGEKKEDAFAHSLKLEFFYLSIILFDYVNPNRVGEAHFP